VWSLGIILVNLTCGRNPWKCASIENSTFRAYLKNPKFLSSILPLSPELDFILRRIFECDPRRRISISELRDLILRCSRFTNRSNLAPPTPPEDVSYITDAPHDSTTSDTINSFQQYPITSYTPASSPPIHSIVTQYSQLTISFNESSPSNDEFVFSSSSSCSTTFSCNSHEESSKVQIPTYVPPQPMDNFYDNFFSLNPTPKHMVPHSYIPSIQVCKKFDGNLYMITAF